MAYSHLLFDFDHTLFDSDASEVAAFDDTMRSFGLDDPAPHFPTYQRINMALWTAAQNGEFPVTEVRNRRFVDFTAEIGLDADTAAMADYFGVAMGANGDLYPGARDLLEQLAESHTLSMVTNALSEVQRARLERLGIANYFATIVISAEVGAVKPHPEIFDITFDRLGRPAKTEALMIGDSLSSDIRGGAAFGIDTCWFNRHGADARDNPDITHTIGALSELPALVG